MSYNMTSLTSQNSQIQERQNDFLTANKVIADSTAEKILLEIQKVYQDFEISSDKKSDIGIVISCFGNSYTMHAEKISCNGINLITFTGKDENNNPIVLVQHVSQLNFLLTTLSPLNFEHPKNKIGFTIE